MKTLILTTLLFISFAARSQTCTLAGVESKTLKFNMESRKTKKEWMSISDIAGNLKWAKKVKIKKGKTQPKLYISELISGKYIIRIGNFFKQEVKL